MQKFVYKLQPVLNLKKQQEDSLKNELGKAAMVLADEKRILNEIESSRDTYITKTGSLTSKGITAGEIKEYLAYIAFLKEKAERQKVNVNNAQINVDKYRGLLLKAMQERKMLEKLREKKLEEYAMEQQREDQRQTDEVVSYKYGFA